MPYLDWSKNLGLQEVSQKLATVSLVHANQGKLIIKKIKRSTSLPMQCNARLARGISSVRALFSNDSNVSLTYLLATAWWCVTFGPLHFLHYSVTMLVDPLYFTPFEIVKYDTRIDRERVKCKLSMQWVIGWILLALKSQSHGEVFVLALKKKFRGPKGRSSRQNNGQLKHLWRPRNTFVMSMTQLSVKDK